MDMEKSAVKLGVLMTGDGIQLVKVTLGGTVEKLPCAGKDEFDYLRRLALAAEKFCDIVKEGADGRD